MTRLIQDDIQHIANDLYRYDEYLKMECGFTLEQVARKAAGCCCCEKVDGHKTAVVPVTSGEGIIEGFSATVAAILSYIGVDAYVTKASDVAGIQEAYLSGADILFMADDEVCSAFSLNGKSCSDNGYATGRSFAAALEMMMEQVQGEQVLVLGAGPVGIAAAEYFSQIGAMPVLCDLDNEKAKRAAQLIRNAKAVNHRTKIGQYRYILDATTEGGFITEVDVTEDTRISAPGVPLCVTPEAGRKANLFHNPLELGIMTMYFDCVNKMNISRKGVE